MNFTAVLVMAVAFALIARCRGPTSPNLTPSDASVKPPCQHEGSAYSPIGRIFKIEDSKAPRGYGTHVLVDGSGNVQWILKSSQTKLDTFAGDNRWYRVDGQISPDHTDLFIVCAAYPSQ